MRRDAKRKKVKTTERGKMENKKRSVGKGGDRSRVDVSEKKKRKKMQRTGMEIQGKQLETEEKMEK